MLVLGVLGGQNSGKKTELLGFGLQKYMNSSQADSLQRWTMALQKLGNGHWG